MENFRQRSSIRRTGIAFESGRVAFPDTPRHVKDAIFNGTSAAPRGIAPIVLRNELLDTAFERLDFRARSSRMQVAPFLIELELIPALRASWPGIFRGADFVPHRMPAVIFAIGETRKHGDRALWNNFADEHDASSISVGCAAPDVKAQIHLVEIRMEWERKNTEQFGAQEAETGKADEGFPVE